MIIISLICWSWINTHSLSECWGQIFFHADNSLQKYLMQMFGFELVGLTSYYSFQGEEHESIFLIPYSQYCYCFLYFIKGFSQLLWKSRFYFSLNLLGNLFIILKDTDRFSFFDVHFYPSICILKHLQSFLSLGMLLR